MHTVGRSSLTLLLTAVLLACMAVAILAIRSRARRAMLRREMDALPGVAPADLAQVLADSPGMRRTVQLARKAGFRIEGSLTQDESGLRNACRLAAAVGLFEVGQVVSLLEGGFDNYLQRLIRHKGRIEPWTVDRPFLVQLLLIRSFADQLSVETLRAAGDWHPVMARRTLQAARDDAAERLQAEAAGARCGSG